MLKEPIVLIPKSSVSSSDIIAFLNSVQHLRYQEVTPDTFTEFVFKFYSLFYQDYSVFSGGSRPYYYDDENVSLFANTSFENVAFGCVFNLYIQYPDSQPFTTRVNSYIDSSSRIFMISSADNLINDTVFRTSDLGERYFHPLQFVYNGLFNVETLIKYRDFEGNLFTDYFLHSASLVCSSFSFAHPILITSNDNLFPNTPNHLYSFAGEFEIYGTYSSGSEYGGTGLCPLDSGKLTSDMQVDFGSNGFALVDLTSSYYNIYDPLTCSPFSIDCDDCTAINNAFRSIYKIVSNLGLLTNGENGDDEDMDYTLQLNSIAQSLLNIHNDLTANVLIDDQQETINITQAVVNNSEVLDDKELTVINNLDYSDRISSKPKTSGYPDDDLLI